MNAGACRVCGHADRSDIDQAIVGGTSDRQIAARWDLSKDSVRRHRTGHLSPALRSVLAKRETDGPIRALDRLEDLYAKASAILDAATAEGKASMSLAAIRELRGLTEILAKITGELDERPQVQVLNVTASPEWADLRAVLLDALAPYPDARLAAARALTIGAGSE